MGSALVRGFHSYWGSCFATSPGPKRTSSISRVLARPPEGRIADTSAMNAFLERSLLSTAPCFLELGECPQNRHAAVDGYPGLRVRRIQMGIAQVLV